MISSPTSTDAANRNPGIVPPWLAPPQPVNSGIVPPWLLNPIHILPIDLPETSVLRSDGTKFVRESADISPTSLADALRGR